MFVYKRGRGSKIGKTLPTKFMDTPLGGAHKRERRGLLNNGY